MFYVIQIEKTLENLFRKSLLLFFFLLGFVHLSYSYLCSFSLFSRSSNVIFHRFYQKQLCCTQSTRKIVSFYLINNFIISSSDKWLSVVVVLSIPFLFRLFFLFESFQLFAQLLRCRFVCLFVYKIQLLLKTVSYCESSSCLSRLCRRFSYSLLHFGVFVYALNNSEWHNFVRV